MKIFFIDRDSCKLADSESFVLNSIKKDLLSFSTFEQTILPEQADVFLIQEHNSLKDFRYINEILNDPFLGKYFNKTFTINIDDCATGILRGLYTSLRKSRFNPDIYGAVPFLMYPNELVFSQKPTAIIPNYLAGWRGNTTSNKIRALIIESLSDKPDIHFGKTMSWLNHDEKEKQVYIDLIENSKFSLCPAGLAPVTFRIFESMALGRCPIIISDEFVLPLGPKWENFALFFPENDINGLYPFLLKNEPRYKELGERAHEAWQSFFGPRVIQKYYAELLFKLITFRSQPSKKEELKRWSSFKLHWSNGWTMPQRILNKISFALR